RWDCTLEPGSGPALPDGAPRFAVRLGLRMAKGLPNDHAALLVAQRNVLPFSSIEELWRRTGLPPASLERLAEADAFGALGGPLGGAQGSDRRRALWQVRALVGAALPLFAAADAGGLPRPELVEPPVALSPMPAGREVVEDHRATGLSLRRHPVAFLRPLLRARGMTDCAVLPGQRDGARVIVPGIVLVRQKPGSAKGVMFITIEDEFGVANLILWPDRFERQRALVLSARMIACHGRVQKEGEVVHVVADRLEDLSDLLRSVGEEAEPFPLRHGRGDGATHPAAADPRGQPAVRPSREPGIRVPTRDFR
ncbi:MAG: error-prone DNA polymerase, partial [Gluconacetobacter diazotrophicus]|nr:error-prone DNA polymerase [Gluconacetobacter diazotrophicus]